MAIRINKYKDLVGYEEELLGIELSEYVDEAVGEIITHWEYEDYAKIRLKIKKGKEEKIVENLTNQFREEKDIETYLKRGVDDEGLLSEMKTREVKHVYSIFMKGKRAMTRCTYIYVTEDKNGTMYVYIFG